MQYLFSYHISHTFSMYHISRTAFDRSLSFYSVIIPNITNQIIGKIEMINILVITLCAHNTWLLTTSNNPSQKLIPAPWTNGVLPVANQLKHITKPGYWVKCYNSSELFSILTVRHPKYQRKLWRKWAMHHLKNEY